MTKVRIMKRIMTHPMKKGKRKKAVVGTEIVSAMQSQEEREVWPGDERIQHKIASESDLEIFDHKIECAILRQIKHSDPA